jgi:hypothetical protein
MPLPDLPCTEFMQNRKEAKIGKINTMKTSNEVHASVIQSLTEPFQPTSFHSTTSQRYNYSIIVLIGY